MLLNALKSLANIDKDMDILSAEVIEPIQKLKVESFGSANPRLHTDEILIALAMSAVTNPAAKSAMEQLPNLRDTDAHATVILSETDTRILKKLGIRVTTEPVYETERLYRK